MYVKDAANEALEVRWCHHCKLSSLGTTDVWTSAVTEVRGEMRHRRCWGVTLSKLCYVELRKEARKDGIGHSVSAASDDAKSQEGKGSKGDHAVRPGLSYPGKASRESRPGIQRRHWTYHQLGVEAHTPTAVEASTGHRDTGVRGGLLNRRWCCNCKQRQQQGNFRWRWRTLSKTEEELRTLSTGYRQKENLSHIQRSRMEPSRSALLWWTEVCTGARQSQPACCSKRVALLLLLPCQIHIKCSSG